MKIRYFLTSLSIIVLFHVFSAQAALPKPIWQSGTLTLWDRTVLEGDLSYNWLLETVLFRQPDGRVCTLSANQLSQFGWFDFSIHKYREFKVLTQGGRPAIFEIYMDGPLVVVRHLRQRHGLLTRTFSHPAYFADQPEMAQNTDYFDYFVYDAGRLREVARFYTDIYTPLMRAYDETLQHYVQVHNINDRSLLGRLLVIDRYNALVEQDAKTASTKGTAGAPE